MKSVGGETAQGEHRAEPGQRELGAEGHRDGRGQLGAGRGGSQVVPGVGQEQ
ncbi:hypothetical protein ABT095_10320 [Kitasatospora sp. NPDC002227]|uniref:hypothetical protein n=1 Tax=Kitasatospora sp. NPDC002227 TaxID=3154773 RepID=UPI0033190BED